MSDKHKSQAERILELLRRRSLFAEEWVSLMDILKLGIACHTRRIHELRKAAHIIELRDEYVDGKRHTAYRVVWPDQKAVA